MPNGPGMYSGGPFRKLLAFDMGADRALKRLRDSHLAEQQSKMAAQENQNFANFIAGGKTIGGFRPFNESNLPNAALLATSKRYAPAVDAMMGTEKLRIGEKDLQDREFDDLLERYKAETDRKEAGTKAKTAAEGDKVLNRSQLILLNTLKRKKQSLQELIIRKHPNIDLAGILAEKSKIPQVPVTRWDPDKSVYVETGEKKYDKDVEDYIAAIGEVQQELENQGIPYDDAFSVAREKMTARPTPKTQSSDYMPSQGGKSAIPKGGKKVKIRFTTDTGKYKAGTVGLIPEDKFNESVMELVN